MTVLKIFKIWTSSTRNKATVSPLRQLPPEILLEIFSWTPPSILNVRRHGSLNLAESPWVDVLSRVCSRWRAVPLSSPSLWSVIAVNYGALGYEEVSSYPASMLQAQLSRSRAQNLRLHFYGSEQYAPGPQLEFFILLTTPAQSIRLEEVSLSLTFSLLPLLINLRNETFPQLRRLYLHRDAAHSRQYLIRAFETAPALTDVCIFNEHHDIPVHLPVRQLTRYSVDGLWDMHRCILQHARLILVEARVDIRFGVVPPPGPREEGDVIELPPAGEKFETYATSLQALVLRSGCPLRRLFVTGNFTTEDTLEILHALPSVKELTVIVDSYSARTEAEHLLICLTPHLDDEDVSVNGIEMSSSCTTPPTLVAAGRPTTISLGCGNGIHISVPGGTPTSWTRVQASSACLTGPMARRGIRIDPKKKNKHPNIKVLLELYASGYARGEGGGGGDGWVVVRVFVDLVCGVIRMFDGGCGAYG
ncbi:hypothetical protein R3P38DRAFT_3281674 [Favolaschia claudopus]|uniref:F-box domain-containing protein n=1 Tax=Favolaschia claudopus TaxID=2862362 RepID=A0AAW0AFK5_9AGAR